MIEIMALCLIPNFLIVVAAETISLINLYIGPLLPYGFTKLILKIGRDFSRLVNANDFFREKLYCNEEFSHFTLANFS